jgi:nucleotide-binding universal stress UspA family protein
VKVLVAIDGSKHALHAVKFAARLVRLLRSAPVGITLINVQDDAGLRHAKAFVGSAEVADYLRELSEKELKSAQKFLDVAGVKHDMEIRIGRAAREIVVCANAGKFDLIVLGSKGRGAVADILLGSVAQRVLAIARQPVLLVK